MPLNRSIMNNTIAIQVYVFNDVWFFFQVRIVALSILTEAVGNKFLDQRSMDQKIMLLVKLWSSFKVNSIDGKRKEDQTYVIEMSISTHAATMSKNVP